MAVDFLLRYRYAQNSSNATDASFGILPKPVSQRWWFNPVANCEVVGLWLTSKSPLLSLFAKVVCGCDSWVRCWLAFVKVCWFQIYALKRLFLFLSMKAHTLVVSLDTYKLDSKYDNLQRKLGMTGMQSRTLVHELKFLAAVCPPRAERENLDNFVFKASGVTWCKKSTVYKMQ